MATSCPGKVVTGRAIHRLVDSWKLQTLRSTVTLSYHMGHTLQEMGFTLRSFDIPLENIRTTQQRHQEEVNGERQNVNSDSTTVVKKEPMEIPQRSKPAVHEVIDLTQDQKNTRSAQETAMDLSMKSGGSDRTENGDTDDDDDDGDNLCIVEDDEKTDKGVDKNTVEKEPGTDSVKESERTAENRKLQENDNESVINDGAEVEMTEQKEYEPDKENENQKDKSRDEEESVKSDDDEIEMLGGKEVDLEKDKETDERETAMDVVEESIAESSAEKDKPGHVEEPVAGAETGTDIVEANTETAVGVNESENIDIRETVVSEESENVRADNEALDLESAEQDLVIDDSITADVNETEVQNQNQETGELNEIEGVGNSVSDVDKTEGVEGSAPDVDKTNSENGEMEIEKINQKEDKDSENVRKECTDSLDNETKPETVEIKSTQKDDSVSKQTEDTTNTEDKVSALSEKKDSEAAGDAGSLDIDKENGDFVDVGCVDGNEFHTDEENETIKDTEIESKQVEEKKKGGSQVETANSE